MAVHNVEEVLAAINSRQRAELAVSKEREAIENACKLFVAKVHDFAVGADGATDPTSRFAKQMVDSIKAVHRHITSCVGQETAPDVEACVAVLESLARTLHTAADADPTAARECVSICSFALDVSGDSGLKVDFMGSFHRPILWVWRELLLAMAYDSALDEDILACVQRVRPKGINPTSRPFPTLGPALTCLPPHRAQRPPPRASPR